VAVVFLPGLVSDEPPPKNTAKELTPEIIFTHLGFASLMFGKKKNLPNGGEKC